MKRFPKSLSGVTLLEVMLVLAIAAMVIVMSVRYYQSANSNQQANAFIAQLQAMQAAADSLAQGSGGSYTGITGSSILAIAGGGTTGANTPWGGTVAPSAKSATEMLYAITTNPPVAVCTLITSRLKQNTKWTVGASCASFTYTATA